MDGVRITRAYDAQGTLHIKVYNVAASLVQKRNADGGHTGYSGI
jgi:hypothetical protein